MAGGGVPKNTRKERMAKKGGKVLRCGDMKRPAAWLTKRAERVLEIAKGCEGRGSRGVLGRT